MGRSPGGRLLPAREQLVRRARRWQLTTLFSYRVGLTEEVCFEMRMKCNIQHVIAAGSKVRARKIMLIGETGENWDKKLVSRAKTSISASFRFFLTA